MTAHATRPAERKRASALEAAGLTPQRAVHWNLGPPELYEHAVRRAEGVIAEGGAFAAVTAPHTGRSPNDKFIVREPASADEMWWNRGNQPLEADAFERLKASLLAHLAEQELFVRDLFAGADVEHRFGLRFVTPNAWHAWSDRGIFNFEGGCYAKVIRLSREGEPEIFATTHMFGTVLENVVVDPDTRAIDLDSDRITENTRASYPIHYIPNHVPGGAGGHPSHILFLTCDAYGIMPPIARLSPAQAMYHFLSGYTAKVAGTERGGNEPKATFSTCFGAPFLPLQPTVYASLLGAKIGQHGVQCWLVNTGWSGGPYGVGQRIRLGLTRAMVRAALGGKLDRIPTAPEPVFGLEVPLQVSGVPDDVLLPRGTWRDPAAYDAQAARLAQMFHQNFEQFQGQVHAAVRDAGPAR